MPFKDFRSESRKKWGLDLQEHEPVNDDRIRLGAILRIADATELMAKNSVQMQNDLSYWKRRAMEEIEAGRRLNRRIRALRGVVTKMRRAK